MRIVAISAAVLVSAIALFGYSPSAHAEAPTTNAVTTVTVQPGDSLSDIATAHSSTYLRLFYANTIINNPDLIFPGQQLRVPDATETLATRPLPADVVAPVDVATPLPPRQNTSQASPVIERSAPRQVTRALAVPSGSVWDQIARCESGGNWATNTGNGFYGGLQFTASSWRGVGGSGLPSQASREEQISRAQILQSHQGWGAWPACAARLGLI
jgi:LysM repeat protein